MQQAAEAVIEFNHTGLSLLEISHRSAAFEAVIEEARALVKELWQLGSDYEVLFLGGGASLQFCMAPYNLLPVNGTAAYLKTGVWADKAQREAQLFGNVHLVASSEDRNYAYIPRQWNLPDQAAYFHITSNNTIYGTQMHELPTANSVPYPIIADMSSDIFSRSIDATQFGLIYAGAQKNIGAAGATLVVLKRDLLGKTGRKIPSMLDYEVHIRNQSMFNTPPVFSVYVCYLTLKWVKERGIKRIEADNRAKAAALYQEIDRNALFEGTVSIADRSMMNVCFVSKQSKHEALFYDFAQKADCAGLKGHRSVGGFRASLYNAMDMHGVETLVSIMREFERKFG